MRPRNINAPLRICALALVAIGIWFAARTFNGLPQPLGLDAPADSFSAARADVILERILGPEIPHPTGSPENANVRARIESEFAALGVNTKTYNGFVCNGSEQRRYIACAEVNDIVAEVVPGEGKALIMMAHYDSVPAGPGAADDASGVATIIETARVLKARGIVSGHPVLAVMTDGEEAGLIGAKFFLDNPEMKARVGVVVNVEARGDKGPSLLFQMSPGDGKLVDLYAGSVSRYAAGSLFPEIYRRLPNDTDLTLFLRAGFVGFNFAFIGGVDHYHTSLDRRENIDLSTLQHQGENILGLTRALERVDFADLQGEDDIYLTVFGRWLPRMPVSWALPVALATFGIAVAGIYFRGRASISVGRQALAFVVPPLMVAGCALLGFLLHALASSVAHQPDPSYAHPAALRIALALGVMAFALFCAGLSEATSAATAAWLWMSIAAIAAATAAPGLTPYFLFPALAGAIALLVSSRAGDRAGEVLLLVASIPALIVWITVVALGEDLMGLAMHPLFTVPAALAAVTLIPLLAPASLPRPFRFAAGAVAGVFAVVVAAFAGTQPAFSAAAPQRLNIDFVDDHIANRALWAVDTAAPLPASLRAAAHFSIDEEHVLYGGLVSAYVAQAGSVRFTVPDAMITDSMVGPAWHVTLALQGSAQAADMLVMVPEEAGLRSVEIGSKQFAIAAGAKLSRPTVIHYLCASGCAQNIGLVFDEKKPVDLTIYEQRSGLPPDAEKLLRARSDLAVPSRTGDSTVIMEKVSLH